MGCGGVGVYEKSVLITVILQLLCYLFLVCRWIFRRCMRVVCTQLYVRASHAGVCSADGVCIRVVVFL